MSTSPRARARPSIETASTGSTISGNSVTMSMRILRLSLASDGGGPAPRRPAAPPAPPAPANPPRGGAHPRAPPRAARGSRREEAPGRERQRPRLRQRHEPADQRARVLRRGAALDRHQHRVALPARRGDPVPLPAIPRRVPQHALGHALEALRMVGERPHAELPAQAVRPRDLADPGEALRHVPAYFARVFARSFRTVFDGCAPFLIHASAFARSIDTVGGWVRGL